MTIKRIRKSFKQVLPLLLFVSVILRSLVAPGYEFANVDENGEFSFGVVWCPGLNNIYALDQVEDHEHEHDHENNKNDHPENSEGDHFTATCGLWTGNASFISNYIFTSEQLLIVNAGNTATAYTENIKSVTYLKNHPPRAPPGPHLI